MTAPDVTPEAEQRSALDKFLAYADRLDDLMGARVRPAYAETCPCGGSVEVGADVPARERGRLTIAFYARHQHCAQERVRDRP